MRSYLLPHLPSKASERPACRTEHAAETQVSLGKLSQRRARIPGTNMVSEPQVRGAGPSGGLCPQGLSLHAARTLRSPLPLFPQFAAEKFLGRIICKEERNGNNTETMNREVVEPWCRLWTVLQPSRSNVMKPPWWTSRGGRRPPLTLSFGSRQYHSPVLRVGPGQDARVGLMAFLP